MSRPLRSRQERQKVSVESTLFLIQEERVENDWPTIVKVDFKGIKAGGFPPESGS
jgi:hypothetical protein